jgi:hypothetical protein
MPGLDLIVAGLKDSEDSRDVVIASNGTSALIYVDPVRQDGIPAIHAHLGRVEWADRVESAETLHSIAQASLHGLAFAVSMRSSDEPNGHGIRGASLVAKPSAGNRIASGVASTADLVLTSKCRS